MPQLGGALRPGEAAMYRQRVELEIALRTMKEQYQRHIEAGTAHHSEAVYLKQLIEDTKRQLGE